MNSIELIALIFAIIVLVKLVFLSIRPKLLLGLGKKMLQETSLILGLMMILIFVVG